MGKTEWAMWANEQGVITSFVLIIGGLVGTASQFDKWEFGTYTLALGFLVLMIEYPRGKRKQGKKTVERGGQKCLTHFVDFLGVFGRNYWVRFVFYLLAAVPSFFFLATILGGASLVFTSLIYFRAALSGETWKPLLSDERPDSSSNKPSEPPKQPPPRGPRSRGQDNVACELEQPETCRV